MSNMIPNSADASNSQDVQQQNPPVDNTTSSVQQPNQATVVSPQQPLSAQSSVQGPANVATPVAPQGAGATSTAKQPGTAPTGVPPALQGAATQHPSIQRAGVLRSIAETLAGGPRYNYTIDPNTGDMTKEPVPMKRGDIALAIALEAVSGSLTGMAQRGPGSAFVGGEKAFQQGEQQVAEKDKTAKAEGEANYARHYQVLETNLRLYNNALQAGRMGVEQNETYVGQFTDAIKNIQDNAPQIVKGVVTEQDMAKYHVTKDTAIPYKVVPLIDPTTGKQVERNGVKISQMEYLVVDPNYKSTLFTPDEIKKASDYGLPWAKALMAAGKNGQPPEDVATTISFYLNCKAQLAAIDLGQNDVNHYYDLVNSGGGGGGGGAKAPTATPTIPNAGVSLGIQDKVDKYAKQYGVPNAVARGLIMKESNGNPRAQGENTPSGQALGLGQLMPATIAKYHITDPFNVDQNLGATMQKFRELLDRYDGDPIKAYAAYQSGENKVDPNASIQDILKHLGPKGRGAVKEYANMIGVDLNAPANAEQYPVPKLLDAIKTDPMMADAWQKLTNLLNATANANNGVVSYQRAYGELAAKNPAAAQRILKLLGGSDALQSADEAEAQNEARRKADVEIAAAQEKGENKQISDEQSSENMETMLRGPADFKFTPDMANLPPDQLAAKLQSMGVTVPENFDALYKVTNYQVGDADFANRKWAKGDPNAMRRDEAIQYGTRYINPNFSELDFNNIVTKRKDLVSANSPDYQQIRSFNTLLDHIGDAFTQVNALRNTNLQFINKPLNKMKEEVGNPAVTETMAAIEPVKKEFMTFLINSHALTDQDRKSGDDLMDMHFSLSQLQENLKRFALTAADRMGEVNEGWRRLTGSNIPGLISQRAARTLLVFPEVAGKLADMDVGGSFVGASTYKGNPGITVSQFTQPPAPNAVHMNFSNGASGWLAPDGTVYDEISRKPVAKFTGTLQNGTYTPISR